MTEERPARRYPASAFPDIQGVRLAPHGATATLVDLSATGALVECTTRLLPGSALTVQFAGSFVPAAHSARVVRCEVAGISPDGTLRFHLGLAFSAPIALPQDHPPAAEDAEAAPDMLQDLIEVGAASAPVHPVAPVLRNRW